MTKARVCRRSPFAFNANFMSIHMRTLHILLTGKRYRHEFHGNTYAHSRHIVDRKSARMRYNNTTRCFHLHSLIFPRVPTVALMLACLINDVMYTACSRVWVGWRRRREREREREREGEREREVAS
jgi:hypothetical protein